MNTGQRIAGVTSSITLKIPRKGEDTAQACENDCFRQPLEVAFCTE